jgi:hypothetical protein
MRRLNAGCVMWRASAAREKLPVSARARKSWSQDRFMVGVLRGYSRASKQRKRALAPMAQPRHHRTLTLWSPPMKIVEIREKTCPISSPIRNAYIDFSKMTLSLVAVVTDVIRDGKPVIGYGFNSNGRYGQGMLMRERFIPRILEAEPDSLLDESGHKHRPAQGLGHDVHQRKARRPR